MNVIEIPAKPKDDHIIRVAAYARVSADKDAAFHSLEQQQDYYDSYIAAHSDWELVGIYSDNAVSGTLADRPEFQRMLADARSGKMDLIVTKSITRFARNTVVLLESVRELKHLGVDVYFEKEHMHSISSEGELLLTLLAMYAEEEARSASENQKWRIKKKFEQGQPWVGNMLGYRLVDGSLVIVPEEAELVRKIYDEFLAGKSMAQIARDFNRANIPAAKADLWHSSVIQKILANEAYTGNLLLQKTYRPDFRTKKSKINHGQVPQYFVRECHAAIISKDDFDRVQEKLEKNRKERMAHTPQNQKEYLFTGLMKCGLCGSAYLVRNRNKGKYRQKVWSCNRYAEFGKDVCPAQSIRDDIMITSTKEALGLPDTAELTRDIVKERISKIIVPGPHQLVYHLKDGTETAVTWQYKSRRESWTPEMRQKAREHTLARYRKEE